MNNKKLLLKSIKRIGPVSIGLVIANFILYFIWGSTFFTLNHMVLNISADLAAFIILALVVWLFYIIKEKLQKNH